MKNVVDRWVNDSANRHVISKINTCIGLGCLGLTQVLRGTIVAVFPMTLPFFFTSQFFGSTVQGGISDLYKRSKVLHITLLIICTVLGMLIYSHKMNTSTFFAVQFACVILIGLIGNADVIGRATLIDIHFKMSRRKIMSWSVCAEASSWLVIGLLVRYLNIDPFDILKICIVFSIIILGASFIFNKDMTEDKKHLHNLFREAKQIVSSDKKKYMVLTVIIILGELSFFFFFYNQEDLIKTDTKLLADTYIAWYVGMTLGSWLLGKFKSYSDVSFLVSGIVVSILGVTAFIFSGMHDASVSEFFVFDSFIYSIIGFGSGIYLPCFYSLISKGHSIHYQGLLTGWVDSLRVFGDAFTNAGLILLGLIPAFSPVFVSIILFTVTLFVIFISKRVVARA